MKRYTFKMTPGGAILALIGAAQVIRWIVNGIAHALVIHGGWAAAEAAKAAPWIFLAVAGGLALSLSGMYAESKHYQRSSQSQYGRIERNHARNPEYHEDKAQ